MIGERAKRARHYYCSEWKNVYIYGDTWWYTKIFVAWVQNYVKWAELSSKH